jgi:DNA primase
MGTAITPEQVQLLAAHADEVVLALDADRAGREAMLRAQRVAAGKRVRLRVASMTAGEDPADLLAGEGAESDAAERFRGILEGADDLPVFHVRMLLDDGDLDSPAGRDRALDEVVPVLAAMPDSITREELEREVAGRLDADPGLVSRRIAGAPRARAEQPVAGGGARGDGASAAGGPGGEAAVTSRPPRALSAHERREQALLAMCIHAPAEGREVLAKLTDAHLGSPVMRRARGWLVDHLAEPLEGLPRDDDELRSTVIELVMMAEREPASRAAMELNLLQLEQAMVEREIAASGGGEASLVELQRRRADLAQRIAHAEQSG